MFEYFCENSDNLSHIKKVLVDSGYTGENFADEIRKISGAEVEVIKRNELHTFSVLPKRWIVERSFGWLDKCRRLWQFLCSVLPKTLPPIQPDRRELFYIAIKD